MSPIDKIKAYHLYTKKGRTHVHNVSVNVMHRQEQPQPTENFASASLGYASQHTKDASISREDPRYDRGSTC